MLAARPEMPSLQAGQSSSSRAMCRPLQVQKAAVRPREETKDEAASSRPAKRPRLPTFSQCNCTVHLIKTDRSVVHVPTTDFCIGRDTKAVGLVLDSDKYPNMVSRTHARLVSNDGGVHVIDCRSLNGTWLNGTRVAHHLLRSGDTLVIGNPNQCPAEFRFSVAL